MSNWFPLRSSSISRCFALSVLLFAVLTQSKTIYSQSDPLIVAVEDDAAPWSRADGTGFANDVVLAAFKAVGVDVQLRVVPYARCKRMAIRGEAVACFSTSPSPELTNEVELSERPLFTVKFGYFYNVSKPVRATSGSTLPANTVIGTVIGYEYPTAFERLKQEGKVVVEESPSEEINLKKLAAGRIDLALLVYNEMKSPAWLLNRAGVGDNIKPTFVLGEQNSYVAFSRKHPRGAWALAQFNKGHRLILNNGTVQRIRKLWLEKLASERISSKRSANY